MWSLNSTPSELFISICDHHYTLLYQKLNASSHMLLQRKFLCNILLMSCQFTLYQKNPKFGIHVNKCTLLHTIFGTFANKIKWNYSFLIHFIHLAHCYMIPLFRILYVSKAWFLPYTITWWKHVCIIALQMVFRLHRGYTHTIAQHW